MSQRLGAWWIAGVVLPLVVVGGLILMHTVESGSAEVTRSGEHAAVERAGASAEMHGERGHGCDNCHVGLHLTTACAVVLGSIAVWRVVRHINSDATRTIVVASAPRCPEPRPSPCRGRPPWVELGVMLC